MRTSVCVAAALAMTCMVATASTMPATITFVPANGSVVGYEVQVIYLASDGKDCVQAETDAANRMTNATIRKRGVKEELADGEYCFRRSLTRNKHGKTKTWTPWTRFTVDVADKGVVLH
jgi:hypothetical protein